MTTIVLIALSAAVVCAADADFNVGSAGFRRSDFMAAPRGSGGQRFTGAAAAAPEAGSGVGDKAVSVGSTGTLRKLHNIPDDDANWPGPIPDQVLDPAFGFQASRQVLAKIKEEAPVRREKWLKGTVALKTNAARARVAAAKYENQMQKLDATVAMADKGVVHLRQDISNEHVAKSGKIREHLKAMKKDVSLQLERAAVGDNPVEDSPFERAKTKGAEAAEMQLASEAEQANAEAQQANVNSNAEQVNEAKRYLELNANLVARYRAQPDAGLYEEAQKALEKGKGLRDQLKSFGVSDEEIDDIDKKALEKHGFQNGAEEDGTHAWEDAWNSRAAPLEAPPAGEDVEPAGNQQQQQHHQEDEDGARAQKEDEEIANEAQALEKAAAQENNGEAQNLVAAQDVTHEAQQLENAVEDAEVRESSSPPKQTESSSQKDVEHGAQQLENAVEDAEVRESSSPPKLTESSSQKDVANEAQHLENAVEDAEAHESSSQKDVTSPNPQSTSTGK